MLQRLEIKNYRSIVDASVDLRPFTILVGANGSGKSNLLKLLLDLSARRHGAGPNPLPRHFAFLEVAGSVSIRAADRSFTFLHGHYGNSKPQELEDVRVFSIDPRHVGGSEPLIVNPSVQPSGSGAVQVLDSLKTGDREDLFNTIEAQLRDFVPEIEKLSFAPGSNAKSLQVRERGIATPVPVSELSEGTRLVLTILTIVHQERKPTLICFEDIDRGLHPALFGKVVDVCRTLVAAPGGPQILATTHNPYLVDQFIDDEDSVILVEKVDARTTFTSLRDRLAGLDRGSDSLGGVWYSGLVGGGPVMPLKHLPHLGEPEAGG